MSLRLHSKVQLWPRSQIPHASHIFSTFMPGFFVALIAFIRGFPGCNGHGLPCPPFQHPRGLLLTGLVGFSGQDNQMDPCNPLLSADLLLPVLSIKVYCAAVCTNLRQLRGRSLSSDSLSRGLVHSAFIRDARNPRQTST